MKQSKVLRLRFVIIVCSICYIFVACSSQNLLHHIDRFDEKVEIITRYNTDILPTEESAKKMALLIWEIGYKYDLSEFENFTIKSLNEDRVWFVQLSTCNKNEKRARCKTYNVVLNKNTSEVLEIWRGNM